MIGLLYACTTLTLVPIKFMQTVSSKKKLNGTQVLEAQDLWQKVTVVSGDLLRFRTSLSSISKDNVKLRSSLLIRLERQFA